MLTLAASTGAQTPAPTLYDSSEAARPAGPIDQAVFARLEALGIKPVLCSDAVFLRRVYLDITGTIPSAEEARRFLEDKSPNRRAVLIEELLHRDQRASYLAMRWSDILRIKAEFPVNLWPNAAQAYHRWVRASVAANMPYDQFARELLTSSGSNFRVGPVNFYRAIQNRTPDGTARAVALAFLGQRAESWPAERLDALAAFFTQVGYKPTREWKEEIVFWDPFHTSPFAPTNLAADNPESPAKPLAPAPPPPAPKPLTTTFPDGSPVTIRPDQDPREVFAGWLVRPDNPAFTRAIANRVWAWHLGRGVIHEADDMRPDNPPSIPALLDALQTELVTDRFDLLALDRAIFNSTTYQLSSVPRDQRPEAVAAFAAYPIRHLEAEVLIDAIDQITATTDLYTSPIPEPFTYIPQDLPAVAIADGSITSPFLTLFGRSARATGMENERSTSPVPGQWLHTLNSSHIQRKLEQGAGLRKILDLRDPNRIIDELYLTILSRYPTGEERRVVVEHVRKTKNARLAAIDLAWALINSPEFLYRH